MKRLPSVQKITETPTKIIRKSKKIRQLSLKIEVWRGPRASWDWSWGHSGAQGCSRSEKYSKSAFVYPLLETKLEAKIGTSPILLMLFCDLFLDKRWGRLPGRFSMDFGLFFGGFFDIFLEFVSGLLHKWKCHSDTLFIMFEAHCRYGKYATQM